MISRELLSEVLSISLNENIRNPIHLDVYHSNQLNYCLTDGWSNINIYELAHECKVWAVKKGFVLKSHISSNQCFCAIESCSTEEIIDCTFEKFEWLAIFKACQWILEKGRTNEI